MKIVEKKCFPSKIKAGDILVYVEFDVANTTNQINLFKNYENLSHTALKNAGLFYYKVIKSPILIDDEGDPFYEAEIQWINTPPWEDDEDIQNIVFDVEQNTRFFLEIDKSDYELGFTFKNMLVLAGIFTVVLGLLSFDYGKYK